MRQCPKHDALQGSVRILAALFAERDADVSSTVAGIDRRSYRAGINTNLLPDRVTLRLDRRHDS